MATTECPKCKVRIGDQEIFCPACKSTLLPQATHAEAQRLIEHSILASNKPWSAVGIAIGALCFATGVWLFIVRMQTAESYGSKLSKISQLEQQITGESWRLWSLRASSLSKNADRTLSESEIRRQQNLIRDLELEKQRLVDQIPKWRKGLYETPGKGLLIGGLFLFIGAVILLRSSLKWQQRVRAQMN